MSSGTKVPSLCEMYVAIAAASDHTAGRTGARRGWAGGQNQIFVYRPVWAEINAPMYCTYSPTNTSAYIVHTALVDAPGSAKNRFF